MSNGEGQAALPQRAPDSNIWFGQVPSANSPSQPQNWQGESGLVVVSVNFQTQSKTLVPVVFYQGRTPTGIVPLISPSALGNSTADCTAPQDLFLLRKRPLLQKGRVFQASPLIPGTSVWRAAARPGGSALLQHFICLPNAPVFLAQQS